MASYLGTGPRPVPNLHNQGLGWRHQPANLADPNVFTITVEDQDDPRPNKGPRSFLGHRQWVSAHSNHFRIAFVDRGIYTFAEAFQRGMHLRDVHPFTMETFLCFTDCAELCDNGNDPTAWDYDHLFKLWIFADKYQCPAFKHRVIETIQVKLFQTYPTIYTLPSIPEVQLVYENSFSFETCNLRRLLVDAWVFAGIPTQFTSHDIMTMPQEFLAEVYIRCQHYASASACNICNDGSEDWDINEPTGRECDSHVKDDLKLGTGRHWCDFHGHTSAVQSRACLDRLDRIWRERFKSFAGEPEEWYPDINPSTR